MTVCEERRHHSSFFTVKNVGWLWKRRRQYTCMDCHQVVEPPLRYRLIAMERK